YPGTAQAATDLLSGRVQVMFSPASTVLQFVADGKLVALASSTLRRASVAPDLPTISEAGLPGFDTAGWFGLLAAAGTARDIIDPRAAASTRRRNLPTSSPPWPGRASTWPAAVPRTLPLSSALIWPSGSASRARPG